MGGRPSKFTKALADEICERIALGEILPRICADERMPTAVTVWRWRKANEEFCNAYAQAREAQMDHWTDELVEISDDGRNDWMEVQDKDGNVVGWKENGEAARRSSLRVDTRKFLMSKIAPKRFGDKTQIAHTGPDGERLELSWLAPGKS